MKQTRSFRRHVLGALAAAALAAPMASTSGCSPGWVSSNLVNGLRVFAVTADKPYAQPGEEVRFDMTFYDGYPDPEGDGPRPVQILWIGGCYNPPGDLYYGCFPQLLQTFQSLGQGGGELPPGLIGFGPTFTTTIPADILSQRPTPDGGSKYGLQFVFFFACAGEIKPIELDPSGKAGFFPFACFDPEGNRLPADSFVPGFAQIYTFEDGRTNQNPPVAGMILDGELIPEDLAEAPTVKACPSTDDERRAVGCFAGDPYEGCTEHEIDLQVEPTIGEIDPGEMVDGKQIYEAVWVDWLVDAGDLTGGGISLISGVTEGYKDEHSTKWIPPAEPGLYQIWGIVRDTRGGSTVVQRYIRVE
ncbi:hypothetical protein [Polyangium sp. 6x1]|uniref:hypothetical protein n=1 Tax=Polyangium sp. 6x1 TaxID=3042689 RepID=UPI002482219A|nr:hypothetical protein [Polyangium sp. 6x1]MDI1447118.1 hypothetical protein [Polyangium sp. 6x1]